MTDVRSPGIGAQTFRFPNDVELIVHIGRTAADRNIKFPDPAAKEFPEVLMHSGAQAMPRSRERSEIPLGIPAHAFDDWHAGVVDRSLAWGSIRHSRWKSGS